MRRVALYGVGWVAAAIVAVLLAWQGVGRVGGEVTDRHPRPLTTDEAREALGSGPNSGGQSGAPPSPGSTPASGPAAAGPASAAPAQRATGTTPSTAGRPPATTPPPSPPTTRPSPPAPAPTTTTTSAIVRTYNLVGGSATLRFDPSGKVTVVWANPNPGFRAGIDPRSDGGVRVRFDSDSHRSELEAWWDGGPRDRVEESGSGGGGGGSGPG